jgi:glyoxylase-like metal-dependent hydrolase (beta-lactamase superfamily II)/rhodanese-related sulfurtransferase
MVVTAIVDEGLGNSSYLVDLGDGGALVVDPERDPRPYLGELERRRLRARFVVETHLHADFVSGARELVASGAELLAPSGSALTHPHRPLNDGDEIAIGGLSLQVIATPGHTPEHLSYLLADGQEQIGLFSGGTLMSGGVARTDLLSSEQTEPLARAAYKSIRERLLTLPDDLVVYPTHGAGSFCSVGGEGSERTTTIGAEKRTNPLLVGDPDEQTFVDRLVAGYGSFPPYFLELREVNRQGPTVRGTPLPDLPQLSVSQLDTAISNGAELVDVRDVRTFAQGHIPRSLSNPWRSQFATWLAWLVARETPIVFVADSSVDRQDLTWAALTVGFERIVGELGGGVAAWAAAGRQVSTIPVVDSPDHHEQAILDVRQESEHNAGHVPGAIHIELGQLAEVADQVPMGEVLVHCGHGERAMTAASILTRAGHDNVTVFAGALQELGPLTAEP